MHTKIEAGEHSSQGKKNKNDSKGIINPFPMQFFLLELRENYFD